MVVAADGESNAQSTRTGGVSRPTVILWRARYEQFGTAGLVDELRSGRLREGRPRHDRDLDIGSAAEESGGGDALEQPADPWKARRVRCRH
ncbi:helix-turn-helix domain-containing protein [Rhodococcus wratislaviensis]|uniref:helix-turn-helix domain-containing protein n=1 Tax=Rhodococcus wratislaviensis TaxID=44752 RepID=UPI0036536567